MTYEPAEDTELLKHFLLDELKQLSIHSICEVGCGSGEIITTLKQAYPNLQAHATDINPRAIQDTQQLAKEKRVEVNVKKGEFLKPFFNQQFDCIFFNTPYLPVEDNENFQELSIEDKALYGGTLGCEVTNQFLDSLHSNIHKDSVIYILISTLTKPNLVEESIRENGFEFEVIGKQKHFFEELLVYKIQPNNVLKHLLEHNYQKILKFDKGKHSHILPAKKNGKIVMVKFGKEQHIQKEIFYLQKLQDTNYVPKIVEYKTNFVIYEKIEGMIMKDYLEKYEIKSLEELENVINRILEICFDLDQRGISKDEMTRPHHHIFINPKNLEEIYFIDFERSTLTSRFQNSRQFIQYVFKYNFVFQKFSKEVLRNNIIAIGKEIEKRKEPINIQELYD